MAYMDALKAIQKRQSEFDDYTDAIHNNKFMSKLNFDPKTMLGLGLAGSGTRMMAAAGHGDIGVNDPSFLADMAPYAGAAMMGVLPLRMLSQAHQRKKRETDLHAQKELARRSPGNIGIGDISKSLGTAAGNVSNTAMNTYMTMMAMGTLGGALGIDGSAALSKAALVPYGLSGATGGPLRAASAFMGFGGLEHVISQNSALTAANSNINPITGGLTSLPWLMGKGVASGLSGIGSLAGHSSNAAIQSAGGLFSSAGAGVSGASDSFLNTALDGSMSGSMMGMAGGIGTMMLLKPILSKVGTFLKENVIPSTGTALLKSGSAMRPRVQMSGQLIKKYSKTIFLDTQTNMAGQQGQLKTAEWLTLSYLGAIEKSVSLIGFISEYIQNIQNGKSVSGHMAQNKIQGHYGHSGIASTDLTRKWQNPEDDFAALRGPAKWWAQSKHTGLNAMNFLGQVSEIGGSLMTPTDWLSSENNPMARMARMREEDRLEQTIASVSRVTGIPTSFLTALETSATSLADMGETAEDKQVTLLGGIHELIRFSAFQLKDISMALGVTEAKSYMNKISDMMATADDETGESDESNTSKFGKWVAGSKLASLGMAGLGAAALGPLGLYAGAIPGMIGGAYEAFQHSKLNTMFSRKKTYATALEDLEADGTVDSLFNSADATQKGIIEEDRRLTLYKNVALMADIMQRCHDCKREPDQTPNLPPVDNANSGDSGDSGSGGGFTAFFGKMGRMMGLAGLAGTAAWITMDDNFGDNGWKTSTGQGVLSALSLMALGVPPPFAIVGGVLVGVWSAWGDTIKEKFTAGMEFIGEKWNDFKETDWGIAMTEGMSTTMSLITKGVPFPVAYVLGMGSEMLPLLKDKIMSAIYNVLGLEWVKEPAEDRQSSIINDRKERRLDAEQDKFLDQHPEYSSWYDFGDNNYGQFYVEKGKQFFKVDNGNMIYDVRANKRVDNKDTEKGIMVNAGKPYEASAATAHIQSVLEIKDKHNAANATAFINQVKDNNGNTISSMGGDKNQVDSIEELLAVMKAISSDTALGAQISTAQQSDIIRALHVMNSTSAGSSKAVVMAIQQLGQSMNKKDNSRNLGGN